MRKMTMANMIKNFKPPLPLDKMNMTEDDEIITEESKTNNFSSVRDLKPAENFSPL